jgi:competence protein CoiA
MLSAKRKSDGKTVLAYFERRSNAPFVCVDCNEEVILKTGGKRVDHFAHANPIACKFATNETDEHRRCKMEIFEALQRQPGVRQVALERALGPVRPDITAIIRGVPVAIEIQMSNLSVERIMRQTIWYARKGIFVLWLLQWTPDLDREPYNPRPWESWLHALYFGNVYFWTGGLNVVSYHFEPTLRSIPEKSWYARGGVKMTAPGYTRRLKRARTPIRGRTYNLVTDFGPTERRWWEGGGITVPDAKLFSGLIP